LHCAPLLAYRRGVDADRRPLRCPRCGAPVQWQGNPQRPFCSERCRLIDLGQWASEGHRIPGEPIVPDDDEPED
jgi:hypothetical protein